MIEIIPAIDIIEGKCVRLEKGDYSKKKVYSADPVEIACMFESWGIRRLHLVDLDGAKASHIVNFEVLNKITSATSLIVDFGGGIKSEEDLNIAFDNGAAMITCGSIAVKDQEKVIKWLINYGPDKIILGTDHRKGKIAITGWLEGSDIDLFTFIEGYFSRGIKKIICTDIEKDGMLTGPSFHVYQEILTKFKGLYVIASGGISNIKDVEKLNRERIPAVIIGKAIYEGKINEYDIKQYL